MQQEINTRKTLIPLTMPILPTRNWVSQSFSFVLFILGIRCDEKLVKWHRQPLKNAFLLFYRGLEGEIYMFAKKQIQVENLKETEIELNSQWENIENMKNWISFQSISLCLSDCYQLLHQQTWKWTQIKVLN